VPGVKVRRFLNLEGAGGFTAEQLGDALISNAPGDVRIDLDHPTWKALHPPPPPMAKPPAEDMPLVQARMDERAAVCLVCPSMEKLTQVEWMRITHCRAQKKRCSCPDGQVSLANGRCPLGNWDKPTQCRPKQAGAEA
jgi:hypothetical protein